MVSLIIDLLHDFRLRVNVVGPGKLDNIVNTHNSSGRNNVWAGPVDAGNVSGYWVTEVLKSHLVVEIDFYEFKSQHCCTGNSQDSF